MRTYATTTSSERVYSPLPTCLQNISKQNEELIRTANIVVVLVVVVAEASNCEKLKASRWFGHPPDASVLCVCVYTRVSLHCEGTRDTVTSVTTEPADLTWTEARLLLFVRFKDFAEKYRDCDHRDAFMCWLSGFEIGTLRPPMALPHHHNIVAEFRYSCIACSFVLCQLVLFIFIVLWCAFHVDKRW